MDTTQKDEAINDIRKYLDTCISIGRAVEEYARREGSEYVPLQRHEIDMLKKLVEQYQKIPQEYQTIKLTTHIAKLEHCILEEAHSGKNYKNTSRHP